MALQSSDAVVDAARGALGPDAVEHEVARPEPAVIVGVTGHRVLAEIDRVGQGIEAALDRIARAFPSRPIHLVCSMAEGADLLAADRALQRGIRLTAVLPFDIGRYKTDFSAAGRIEFERLITRASKVVVVPRASSDDRSYEAAGIEMLARSDVLIAIWDGQRAQGRGGTGGIVALARRRRMPIAWVHAGNRRPGTMEPTTLGGAQGQVTFEHFAPPPIPFRIRIALAGACDVTATDELRARIRRVLDREVRGLIDPPSRAVLQKNPSVRLAYTLVTSLCPGAERLVVREARERSDYRVDVVLPLAEEDCLVAMGSQTSREEFAALRDVTRYVWVRQSVLKDQPASPQHADAVRAAYTNFDHYLVDHTDVILVVGEPQTAAGNPRNLLAYAKSKRRPVITIGSTPPYPVTVEPLEGLSASAVTQLADFNRWRQTPPERDAYVDNADRDFFKGPGDGVVAEAMRATIKEVLLPFYTQASTLAKHNQRKYSRAGRNVYWLALAAVMAVAGGLLVAELALPLAILEVTCLIAVLMLALTAHFNHRHRRYVENRFVAERLRSAVFLAACGVEARRISPPPYLAHVKHPDDWMLRVFDEVWNRLPRLERCSNDRCAPLNLFVRTRWLGDQITFHLDKSAREGRSSRRYERAGHLAFIAALAVAVFHLEKIVGVVDTIENWIVHRELPAGLLSYLKTTYARAWAVAAAPKDPWARLLAFSAVSLPAVGATMGGIRAHKEHARLAKRHASMAAALTELDQRFQDVASPAGLIELLSDAEELMLRETQDWVMLIALKPVEAV